MRRTSGMSLLDILIGVAILGIGVLIAFAIVGRSLQFSAKAEQLSTVTEVAKAEMEWRLKSTVPNTYSAADNEPCDTYGGGGCTVVILGCVVDKVAGAYEFDCPANPDDLTETPIAYLVSVTYTGPRGDTVTLESMTTGYDYIAGAD